MRGGKKTIHAIITWMRRQPPKAKALIAVLLGMTALVLLRIIVHDHDNLFVAAEAVHSLGISVLIYKLIKEKTCAGLSLKSQELTALFLAVRLYCSFVMEYDIHTLLDLATFATTVWVIYMIRFKLRSSYMNDKDNFAIYHVVLDSRGHLLVALGYGLWPSMVLISEIVQTFILADFCYYYVQSVFGGQLVLRLPSGVV
ncbi:uncharacterized protein HKW66_Vig0093280 [Vigna angularis]|uniref:ER lumen protein retaining receptor n=1 Tax=Phaseolus angularis TaxID=3914 RepID=A0A8T0KNS0_PHAAN|nr:uncharacterized protein HKW66_Vig0093280 [Vigna angularis]